MTSVKGPKMKSIAAGGSALVACVVAVTTPFMAAAAEPEDRPKVVAPAIDAEKIRRELGWVPAESFETGLRRTVEWYITHMDWAERVSSGEYRQWIETNYTQRA